MVVLNQRWFWIVAVATLMVMGLAGLLNYEWLADFRGRPSGSLNTAGGKESPGEHPADEAPGEDHSGHGHTGHDEANSLELSQQARKNIGLELAKIELQPFERTITVPGIVVERPGRSTLEVSAPLTGVVTRIESIQGEAVEPGQRLFELRLTHEDLVQAQGDFLRTAEELDVIQQEVDRLEKATSSGAVARKTFLERKYEQQKQEAVLRAQRQALILHGLSTEQVDGVLENRELLQNLSVAVPEADEPNTGSAGETPLYQVQELKVQKGQHVTAGDTLAVLADHAVLLVEGNAFEKDVPDINVAVENGWSVVAVVESESRKPRIVSGLDILYLAGQVDADSRAFHFYVTLPNAKLRDTRRGDGHRFVYWRFKPGQRVQLRIPVERWPDRIVLPVDAVAQEGPESYVFQPNGDHLERRPVHVEYRDQFSVVIANDGSLFPGDMVAVSAAQQLQLALKNKTSGGVDPHAGHDH